MRRPPIFLILLALAASLALWPAPASADLSSNALSITKSASPTDGLVVGDTVNFCLNVSTAPAKTDILWVIDVSNSMQVGINNIIANINTFNSTLAGRGFDYRNGLMIYTGDSFNWYYHSYGWTSDDTTFSSWLNDSLSWIYGGIEWSLEALKFADTNYGGWRPDAKKVMVLITDEALPCSETGYIYPMSPPFPAAETIAGTASFLAADGVSVYSISKPWPWDTDPEHRCDPEDLPPLAGGLWLDYSTPAPGWAAMLNQMANSIAGQSNIVISDPVPPQLAPIVSSIVGGSLSGNDVLYSVSSSARGSSFTYCFDAIVSSPWPGLITNTADVSADDAPTTDSNPVPLVYATPTSTPTFTNSPTPTDTPTITPTDTPTLTLTSTLTFSFTSTPSFTDTPSFSFTPTDTSTRTPSITRTSSATDSPTPTLSSTSTLSLTLTSSLTSSMTSTRTASPTPSPTRTASPSATLSSTDTSTRTASPTYTDSPTYTNSPTVTPTRIPEPYHLQLSVYNSAGERVKIVYDGGVSLDPASSTLDTHFLSDWGVKVRLLLEGMTPDRRRTLDWDGTNSQEQPVSNGSYWLKMEVKNEFGDVKAYDFGVLVNRPARGVVINISNSAGERVDQIQLPQGSDLGSISLDEPGGPEALIRYRDSSGTARTALWAGVNAQGRSVAQGTYLIQVDASAERQTFSFSLLKGPALPASLRVLPNPLGGAATMLRLDFSVPPGAVTARALCYGLSGELLRSVAGPAGPGSLWLDSSGLAGGIYIIELSVDGANAYRRLQKIAILR